MMADGVQEEATRRVSGGRYSYAGSVALAESCLRSGRAEGLREALDSYGSHWLGCPAITGGDCNCGLRHLRALADKTPDKEQP